MGWLKMKVTLLKIVPRLHRSRNRHNATSRSRGDRLVALINQESVDESLNGHRGLVSPTVEHENGRS